MIESRRNLFGPRVVTSILVMLCAAASGCGDDDDDIVKDAGDGPQPRDSGYRAGQEGRRQLSARQARTAKKDAGKDDGDDDDNVKRDAGKDPDGKADSGGPVV